MSEEDSKSIADSAYLAGPLVDYKKQGSTVEYLGTEDVDGTNAHKLKVSLKTGDTVITNGGLVAKVTKVVDDDQIEVEISDGVKVRQMRSMVSEVRAKGEPAKDDAA